MTVRINEAFSRLAAYADFRQLPRPVVIRGRREIMISLLDMIAEDLNAPTSVDFRRGARGLRVGVYAGVEFREVVNAPSSGAPDDEFLVGAQWTPAEIARLQWLKHFGPLAELQGGDNDDI